MTIYSKPFLLSADRKVHPIRADLWSFKLPAKLGINGEDFLPDRGGA